MLLKMIGLLFLWGTIIFTVMQKNDIIWVVSALCSIILMHFIPKWQKLGGLSHLGLQVKKGWFRFFLFGSLIGTVFQLIRFSVMYSTGAIRIQNLSVDTNALMVSTIILLISTVYIGFAEEIVFRGYVVSILPYSPKIVVVISAILFTLGHLIDGDFAIARMCFLFIAGLFFAICYVVTRSLWFVVGIHWFWDFSWFYLGADGGTSSAKIINVAMNENMKPYYEWIDVVVVLGLLLLLLILTRKSFLLKKS
ncbi:CPBP family intramembrane glutamic endopeptidase [Lederbergia panacisoli]|uniref:CPBP family intramembrane glutamic endopeptidase n=1 Tax=Lederbergia panacisoli TaxID=1255251 RepID=UPI00214AA8A0|nr:CPBP family intramembrane glutamic endopeptidase [Lederbergia panacisoli]MCR2822769.1 CPBP family intramembrane metalloprotease [Lederbergia panacisoli]